MVKLMNKDVIDKKSDDKDKKTHKHNPESRGHKSTAKERHAQKIVQKDEELTKSIIQSQTKSQERNEPKVISIRRSLRNIGRL
jgi:hypothetical protein